MWKTQEKDVKVIGLTQCEKCGKKLSARTLKYSHTRVCPANVDNQPVIQRKKESPIQEVVDPKLVKQQRRHGNLISCLLVQFNIIFSYILWIVLS